MRMVSFNLKKKTKKITPVNLFTEDTNGTISQSNCNIVNMPTLQNTLRRLNTRLLAIKIPDIKVMDHSQKNG